MCRQRRFYHSVLRDLIAGFLHRSNDLDSNSKHSAGRPPAVSQSITFEWRALSSDGNLLLGQPARLQPITQPRNHKQYSSEVKLWRTFAKLRIHSFGSGVQDRAQLRHPVHATEYGRSEDRVLRIPRFGAPGVVRVRETEAQAHGHGLAIVELGVRRPARVEDVRLVPVEEVAARARHKCDEREAEASGREFGDGFGRHCFFGGAEIPSVRVVVDANG